MKLPMVTTPSICTGAGHLYPDSKFLRDKFTFKTRFGDEVQLYKVTNQGLLIPRNCGTLNIDQRIKGIAINCNNFFKPRKAEQERLVSASTRLLLAGKSHIMESPTGSGKTIMGVTVAASVKKKTLIVIPKTDIIKHWCDAIEVITGQTRDNVGLIQADSCSVAGRDFVIALVHSICKDGRYPDWVYKEFGLILFDEVHKMSAETFSQAMWLLPGIDRLGLSATTYRQDGKEFIFHAHIGPVSVVSDELPLIPKVFVKASAWKVPIISTIETDSQGRKLIRKHKLPVVPGKSMNINKLLGANEARNNVIVNFMFQAYKAGRTQMFFSELKDGHLSDIELMLVAKGIPKNNIGWYVGGSSEAELDIVKCKRIMLATYRMAELATNIPWLDTVILGTPRSDVIQIVGRALREHPDKKQPIVLDVVDTDSEVYMGYFEKRKAWYKSIGAEIISF